MMKIGVNIWVMAICWLLVTGVGVYYTFVVQPEELQHLQKAEQVAKLKQAEFASLKQEHASVTQMSEDLARKWRARYKVIPKKLTTAEVVGYFNDLTRSGFENFDISFAGQQRAPEYSYYTFNFTGRAYYNSLYEFVWEIENNRNFYRVHDLRLNHIDLVSEDKELKTSRLKVMVSFTGKIDAYFNGIEGASAPESLDPAFFEDAGITISTPNGPPPVPGELLPDVKPARNLFYPAILAEIPPNTYGLVDVEHAQLVSIVADKAVFKEGDSFRAVARGESVYLGRLTEVDPARARVVARLNKGGIIDEVELRLEPEDALGHARGPAQLWPLIN